MRNIIVKDYEKMSKKAADMVASFIQIDPELVIALPTGHTPLKMYKELISLYKQGEVDFSNVRFINLDEYYPIKKSRSNSFYYYLENNFLSKINVKAENIHLINGAADSYKKECKRYQNKIKKWGKIDLVILGLGENGHIGFNEPDDFLKLGPHLNKLSILTRNNNSEYFASFDEVPLKAITIGIDNILNANKILLLANGKHKQKAVSMLFSEKISTYYPVSFLRLHKNVISILDKKAAGQLRKGE